MMISMSNPRTSALFLLVPYSNVWYLSGLVQRLENTPVKTKCKSRNMPRTPCHSELLPLIVFWIVRNGVQVIFRFPANWSSVSPIALDAVVQKRIQGFRTPSNWEWDSRILKAFTIQRANFRLVSVPLPGILPSFCNRFELNCWFRNVCHDFFCHGPAIARDNSWNCLH